MTVPVSTNINIEWDWDIEHEDRKREREYDASLHDAQHPFEVDRRVLKDVVREKMDCEVGRIKFMSSGTFHKAYLITLESGKELVARVARRFMPRLKTESEIATMHFVRKNTRIPVPTVYHYDANPYNRLGGEYILMSKASGVPLSRVFHSMHHNDLTKLLDNLALLILPLFSHRFSHLGSLYFGSPPLDSALATPKSASYSHSSYPLSPTLSSSFKEDSLTPRPALSTTPSGHSVLTTKRERPSLSDIHVGPIISWPFFGSNRGDLSHPDEIDRGPWTCTDAYLEACVRRELDGVVRENEGKAAPHKIHLDPDEIQSSRHHHVKAVPGDCSDDSDEWDLEESEEEWEGPGDHMYRDYRRMQRSTFLVAHMEKRVEMVKGEMERWKSLMERLVKLVDRKGGEEEFGIDCHDLSLENVFVDEKDNCRITCIIDWESTTTRPLWACAHLPAFLQSSPFLSDLFRQAIKRIIANPPQMSFAFSSSSSPHSSSNPPLPSITLSQVRHNGIDSPRPLDLPALGKEWLYYESTGFRLRMAHRVAEWDGWEEGLADSILGGEDVEEEWFKDTSLDGNHKKSSTNNHNHHGNGSSGFTSAQSVLSPMRPQMHSRGESVGQVPLGSKKRTHGGGGGGGGQRHASSKLPVVAKEKEKESILDTTGDICGGRGGELGRRLEAWLSVNEHREDKDGGKRGWQGDDAADYEAEAE